MTTSFDFRPARPGHRLRTAVLVGAALLGLQAQAGSLADGLRDALRQGLNQPGRSGRQTLMDAFNPAAWRCNTLLEWVRQSESGPLAAPAAGEPQGPAGLRAAAARGALLDERTSWLISDEVFVKHFDKRYEQLTEGDFRDFQNQTAPACQRAGNFTPTEWRTVQQLWHPGLHARIVQAKHAQAQEQARRAAAESAAQQQLLELTRRTTDDSAVTSLGQLAQLREQGRKLAGEAGASAHEQFESAWMALRDRRAAGWLAAELRGVREQSGSDLGRLIAGRQAVQAQAKAIGLEMSAAGDDWHQLQQQESAAAATMADGARKAMDRFPDGLAGLEAGVAWHAQYPEQWSRWSAEHPALARVAAEFQQRRSVALSHGGPSLIRGVEATTTIAQAQGFLSRYTLPLESREPPVLQAKEAIETRVRLIERNNALGHATLPGPAQHTRAPAVAPTAAPTPQRGGDAPVARGEPSEEAMYELVRIKFEKAAARIRGLYEQCQGGGDRNNGMNMMLCLGLNLQSAVTGGAAAQATRITRFRKIGCATAGSEPGFNCEYKIDTDSAIDQQMQKMTGFAVDRSGYGKARFVADPDGGWLMISSRGP